MAAEPNWSEVLRAALDNRISDVHVALPGRVVKYDAAKQVADIQPMVRRAVERLDGEVELEDLPICPNVPIAWPHGGGYYLHFPLAEGDDVELVFNEAATAQYRESGELSPPGDLRRHSLGYAFAVPCRLVTSKAFADAPTEAVVIVPSGGKLRVSQAGAAAASEAVALAEKVTAQLEALKDAISEAATGGQDGGAAFKAAILAALEDWPGDIASTSLDAEG
jgi:phage tail protein X